MDTSNLRRCASAAAREVRAVPNESGATDVAGVRDAVGVAVEIPELPGNVRELRLPLPVHEGGLDLVGAAAAVTGIGECGLAVYVGGVIAEVPCIRAGQDHKVDQAALDGIGEVIDHRGGHRVLGSRWIERQRRCEGDALDDDDSAHLDVCQGSEQAAHVPFKIAADGIGDADDLAA